MENKYVLFYKASGANITLDLTLWWVFMVTSAYVSHNEF